VKLSTISTIASVNKLLYKVYDMCNDSFEFTYIALLF